MQQIGFTDLKLHCLIGIHPEERLYKQPLLISLTLDTKEFIDYTELADLCRTKAEEGAYFLLETLARDLISSLYHTWPFVIHVTVTLKKPQAVKDAAYAFVRLSQ